MTTATQETLFGPETLGIDVDTWQAALGALDNCLYCGRRLRRGASRSEGAGPRCREKLGSTVNADLRRRRAGRLGRVAAMESAIDVANAVNALAPAA